MSKSPLVSVIIPVFNTGNDCLKLLGCLLNSTHKNIEIICIDDGSKDDSYKVLSDFAKKHSQVTVKTQKNGGPSAARNTGIKLAKGDYISFIDSDDLVTEDFIERLGKFKFPEEYQNVDALGALLEILHNGKANNYEDALYAYSSGKSRPVTIKGLISATKTVGEIDASSIQSNSSLSLDDILSLKDKTSKYIETYKKFINDFESMKDMEEYGIKPYVPDHIKIKN